MKAEITSNEGIYALRDPQAVTTYLEQHEQLVSVLVEARGELLRAFPDARLTLYVNRDVDAADGPPQLVVSIATGLEPGQAVDTLNRFCRTWWLHVSGDAREWLAFDLELV